MIPMRMSAYEICGLIVAVLWLFLIGYWIASARGVKRDVERRGKWWLRATVFATVAIAVTVLVPVWRRPLVPPSATIGVVATVFTAAGVTVAVWARRCLGRNWSSQPALKEGHELVTSGPYRLVRHPIYTGVILAFLGTALVNDLLWGAVFLCVIAVFVMRVRVEERLMLWQFPDQYPDYMKRTKALVPFVW